MKTRAWLGWGGVLIVGCLIGGWLAKGRVSQGSGGLLPSHLAKLAFELTPEGPFTVRVSTRADGPATEHDGAQAISLAPGDYFIDVVPATMAYQPKKLKVHLSGDQVLSLPVVLTPARPAVVPVAPEVIAPEPVVEVVPFPPSDPPAAVAPDPVGPNPGSGTGEVLGIDDFYLRPGPHLRPGTVIRGRVADAQPKLDGTQVDAAALARYIRSRKAAIQGCYEKELKRDPALKGKVVVRFVITRMGRASEIGIEEDTMGKEAVGSCVKAIVRGWVLPFKPETDVPVTYPFAFSPAPP